MATTYTKHSFRWIAVILFVVGIAIVVSYSSQSKHSINSYSDGAYNSLTETIPISQVGRINNKMMVQNASFGKYEGENLSDLQKQDRLVIRNAELSIVSDNVQNSVKSITEYVEQNKGFIVSVNLYDLEDSPSANLTVRVPEKNLIDAITFIREQGIRVVNETVSGQDVTEEFVDNQARLDNLEASEDQFLSIMKRAGKIEDVLAVQRELERVRGSIERIKARQKFLKQSAEMSRIQVYIATDEKELPIVEENQWRPLVVVKDALRLLIETFQKIADALIWIIIFLPVWGTAILIYLKFNRKK